MWVWPKHLNEKKRSLDRRKGQRLWLSLGPTHLLPPEDWSRDHISGTSCLSSCTRVLSSQACSQADPETAPPGLLQTVSRQYAGVWAFVYFGGCLVVLGDLSWRCSGNKQGVVNLLYYCCTPTLSSFILASHRLSANAAIWNPAGLALSLHSFEPTLTELSLCVPLP